MPSTAQGYKMTHEQIQEMRALREAHKEAADADTHRIIQQLFVNRTKRGATQAAVAHRASVSPVTLCNMEARRSPPTLATLARAARALGYKLILLPVGVVVEDDAPLPELDAALREKSARDAAQARRAVDIAQRALELDAPSVPVAAQLGALELEIEGWPWGEAGAPPPVAARRAASSSAGE